MEGRRPAVAPAVTTAPTESSRAAEIGRSYDAVPYDPGPHAALGLAQLRGAAAALGVGVSGGPVLDVLDIGCGTGAQLLHAAGKAREEWSASTPRARPAPGRRPSGWPPRA